MKSLNPQSYGKFKFGQLRIINTIKKVVIRSLIRVNLCVFFFYYFFNSQMYLPQNITVCCY